MKPKGIAIFAAIGISLAVIIFFVVRSQQAREPNYQGRSLSSWLEDFSDEDTNVTSQAGIAVRSIGTNAIPLLLEILSYEESPIRTKLRPLTDKLPGRLQFFERDYRLGIQAADAMNALGSAAEPVIPTLTNLFYNGKPTRPGIALAGIGQKGVLFLVDVLTNLNLTVGLNDTSALVLGSARSDFEIVVPALIQVLRATNSSTRWMAAVSLGTLHQKPEIAVPALMENLDDPDWVLRTYVFISLGQFGNDAKAAVPLLFNARKDPDENIRRLAEKTLQKISPESLNQKTP